MDQDCHRLLMMLWNSWEGQFRLNALSKKPTITWVLPLESQARVTELGKQKSTLLSLGMHDL